MKNIFKHTRTHKHRERERERKKERKREIERGTNLVDIFINRKTEKKTNTQRKWVGKGTQIGLLTWTTFLTLE